MPYYYFHSYCSRSVTMVYKINLKSKGITVLIIIYALFMQVNTVYFQIFWQDYHKRRLRVKWLACNHPNEPHFQHEAEMVNDRTEEWNTYSIMYLIPPNKLPRLMQKKTGAHSFWPPQEIKASQSIIIWQLSSMLLKMLKTLKTILLLISWQHKGGCMKEREGGGGIRRTRVFHIQPQDANPWWLLGAPAAVVQVWVPYSKLSFVSSTKLLPIYSQMMSMLVKLTRTY